MWELDYKESWVSKNWCFWTVVLKTLESPLDWKEIKPVHLKGNQSCIFVGKIDTEAPNTLATWWEELTQWKRPLMLGKIEGRKWRGQQRMRLLDGITDSMGMSLSKLPEDGEGQGSLACCSPWGCKESDTQTRMSNETTATAWLENYENNHYDYLGLYFMILVEV